MQPLTSPKVKFNPMPVSEKLNPLTSLRFVAAALIVLHHSRGLFGISDSVGHPFILGHGVSFFFVLSGFILVYVYPTLESLGSRRFWLARVARIWPAHVAAILLLFFLVPSARPTFDLGSVTTVLANGSLVHAWIPLTSYFSSYNSVSWSVSTEFAFYLLFPILIIDWRRTWYWKLFVTLLLAWGMIVLTNVLSPPPFTPSSKGLTDIGLAHIHPIARLFEFALGMSAALAFQYAVSRLRNISIRWWIGSLVEVCAVAGVIYMMYNTAAWANALGQQSWIGTGGRVWLSMGGIPSVGFAILILVLALQLGGISQMLSIPILVLLGEISYSVYLVHQILLRYYDLHEQPLSVIPNPVLFLGFVAVTLLCSFAMWSIVEKPFRSYIVGLRQQRRASGAQVQHMILGTSKVWSLSDPPWRWRIVGLIILLALVVPIGYVTEYRPSFEQVTSAYAEEVAIAGLQDVQDVRFGDKFALTAADLKTNGSGANLELIWKSLIPQELVYFVAVHLVDASGNTLNQDDYPQDSAEPMVPEGTLWRDVVPVSAQELHDAYAIAIGLYMPSEGLLPIDRGLRDWNNRRLLLPFTEFSPSSDSHPIDNPQAQATPFAGGSATPIATTVATPVPLIEDLRPLPGGFIDTINRTRVARPQKLPIPVEAEDPIRVAGWAVDFDAGGVAGGVFVVVDDIVRIWADYGQERSDIAGYLGSAYLNSGYVAEIPAGALPTGTHTVEVWVVNQDRDSYYGATAQLQVAIEVK